MRPAPLIAIVGTGRHRVATGGRLHQRLHIADQARVFRRQRRRRPPAAGLPEPYRAILVAADHEFAAGEQRTPQTVPVWPCSVATGWPVSASQRRAVPSSQPLASKSPSASSKKVSDGRPSIVAVSPTECVRQAPDPNRVASAQRSAE